ncbi:MAG: zinc ribbon domain-containing protein [Desulfobacterales bacterium]|jgi:putative FmdB family regulatory protein
MPIYEYECTKCAKIEEIFQKFSDKPLVKCQHCGGKLHKLISQSTFHLKGTGWYVTDYANKAKSNSAAAKKAKQSKTSQASKSANPNKVSKSSSDSSAD